MLSQIFRAHPRVIADVFPEYWSFMTASMLSTPHSQCIMGLRMSPLLEIFNKVVNILLKSTVKVCFFIDGLDEYSGRPQDLVNLIKILGSSSLVKLCLSNRPWNEFECALGKGNPWKLSIHNLAHGDIKAYTEDVLGQDSLYRELLEHDGLCPDLVSEIVDAAQGVFLWVSFVTRSLPDGLTNCDRVIDLLSRLRSLPTDLEEYFDRIIFTVDPRYRRQTAILFHVALTTKTIMPLMAYDYMDQHEGNFSDHVRFGELKVEHVGFRQQQMRGRLIAATRGLLEVRALPTPTGHDRPGIIDPTTINAEWCGADVGFLHRTVVDFLNTKIMYEKLKSWVGEMFDVDAAVCFGLMALVNAAPSTAQPLRSRCVVPIQGVKLLKHVQCLSQDPSRDNFLIRTVDELDYALEKHTSFLNDVLSTEHSAPESVYEWISKEIDRTAPPGLKAYQPTMETIAIRMRLSAYVDMRVGQILSQPNSLSTLRFYLDNRVFPLERYDVNDVRIVSNLLRKMEYKMNEVEVDACSYWLSRNYEDNRYLSQMRGEIKAAIGGV